MSFIKNFFETTGKVVEGAASITGDVMQAGGKVLSETTGINEFKRIGDVASASTKQTGRTLSEISTGVGKVGEGLLQEDDALKSEGLDSLGNTLNQTAHNIKNGVSSTAHKIGDAVEAISDGDYDSAKKSMIDVGVVAAGAIVGIGIVENFDVVEAEAEIHHVEPHHVEGYTTASGTEVASYWRDGDGDTHVDLSSEEGGGYFRSNPDGITSNNLKG